MKKSIKSIIILTVFLFATLSFAQQYSTHKVQSGETVISIAKKYNVTPFDIYKLNPDAKNGIQENAILIIPKSNGEESRVRIENEFVGYKVHKVRRRETLYGLAKQYDVTEDDLKRHNTFLYSENLKRGQTLQIPVFKKVLKIAEVVEDSYKDYVIQPKEGKWRIAYKFGISIDELERLNPTMGDSLQAGQVIRVPNIASNEEKTIDERYGYYKVLPKEGFYRLKVKLGLSQEDLETLNPELKEEGLKAGMILKVPLNTFDKTETSDIEAVSLSDSIQNYAVKNLVVMLPFKLHTVELDSVEDSKRRIKEDRSMSVSLDFYTGVLVALDSAKQMGISTNLRVFDTKNLQTETLNIIRDYDFSSTDVVIGPLMQANFEKAASALAGKKVPVVSPLTKEVQLYENVFQSRPSTELLRDKMIQFVQNDSLIKRVFIIHDSKSISSMKLLKSKFPNAKVIASRKNKEGKDLDYVLFDDFIIDKEENINVFSEGKNVVFLETENPGLVSNVTSILNSLNSEEKSIVLVTTDKNSAFEDESISNIYLSNLQFHYPSIRKDYDVSNPDGFVTSYKSKYGYSPNLYAVRGFDVTMDILLRLASFENLYDAANLESETNYVENKFLYKKKLFGGYYNTAAYIVKYDNLSIVEVE